MTKKLSHIGIAVREINATVEFFKQNFGLEATDRGTGKDSESLFYRRRVLLLN